MPKLHTEKKGRPKTRKEQARAAKKKQQPPLEHLTVHVDIKQPEQQTAEQAIDAIDSDEA